MVRPLLRVRGDVQFICSSLRTIYLYDLFLKNNASVPGPE